MSIPSTKLRGIRTSVHTLTARVTIPAGLFRPAQRRTKSWTVLDSTDLLHSLHVIRDNTSETHTRSNLTMLIEQIETARLDV